MIHQGWRPLAAADPAPRLFEPSDSGWFRYPLTSEQFGTPLGATKLRRLRSSSPQQRSEAAGGFAKKVAEFLAPAAAVAFMPSSTRPSAESDPTRFPYLVLSRLRELRPDVSVVEPLRRTAPVPPVHETRIHDVSLLRSTLEPADCELDADELHVLDDMVGTGATYAAFRDALRVRWPRVRPVLLALVFAPKRPKLSE